MTTAIRSRCRIRALFTGRLIIVVIVTGVIALYLSGSTGPSHEAVPDEIIRALQREEFGDESLQSLRAFLAQAEARGRIHDAFLALRSLINGARRQEDPPDRKVVDMALAAHHIVLQENGGEWRSDVHKARVDYILSLLAANARDNPESYTITFLNSRRINAMSTADGRIYLTRGLVTTSTDDEIAMVLAHEMHHIRAGHWENWWSDEVQEPRDVLGEPAIRALAARGVLALSRMAITSYEQEFEADAYAVYLATAAGFDPSRMYRPLTRLPELPVTSHPSVSLRVQGLTVAMQAMEEEDFIRAHLPASVVRGMIESALSGESSEAPGLAEIASRCLTMMHHVAVLMVSMKSQGLLLTARPPDRSLIVRSTVVGPGLAVVDVGVDTSLGVTSSGTPGMLVGRVWLVKQAGEWIWAWAHSQTGPVAGYWQKTEKGLEVQAHVDDADIQQVLALADRWRSTFVSDFQEHLALYARGRVAGFNGFEAENIIEALGLARFLAGSGHRASMVAWNPDAELHSDSLATTSFYFALELGELPLAIGRCRLTAVREDGQWRIAHVVMD